MKLAFHFVGDHPELGGAYYGSAARRLVFSSLLGQRRVHVSSKIFVGDLLFWDIDTSRDGRYRSLSSANRKHADILEFWLHPRNPGEMVEEPQGQGSLDGEIRVAPLPTPPAAPAGRPGRDRFRGQPHRHIAAANEGLIVGRPVRNAVLRLIRGIDLQLHPCSVAPAEGPEKCGSRRPTRSGYSCNNAPARSRGPGERRRPDTARLAEWCDAAIAFWEELSVKLITRYYPFGGRNAPGSGRRVYRHETVPRAAGRPAPGDRHTGRQPEGRHQAGEGRLVERAERPRHGVARAAEDRPANRHDGHALAPCHQSAALPVHAPDERCRQSQN